MQNMQRVLVIGCPGSGKSTFSRKLRDVTGLPLYPLDLIWHRPDRTTVSREAFDSRLGEILQTERWILDGNYGRTLEVRLAACDTVFLMDYPQEICLSGIRERVGKPHEDLPWVETELDEEFYQYVLAFRETRLPRLYALLEAYRSRTRCVVFHNRDEANAYLENI